MRYLTSFNTDLLDIIECDVFIVGSGIAGLFTACNIDNSLKVCLISKADLKTNNSYLAQGGMAITFNKLYESGDSNQERPTSNSF